MPTDYVPHLWHDLPATDTSISAARLLEMETALARADRQSIKGMYASSNGIQYNGTDESAALNALLVTAATFGVTVVLDPLKTLSIASTILMQTGSRLNLNGATIFVLASGGTSMRAITVSGVANVMIWGGTINGNRPAFAPVTEQRHNLLIVNSQNVAVFDLISTLAKGDGVYVGDQTLGAASDVYLSNVTCDTNWRNGMSITHVSGLTAVGCHFVNTGGTNPQAGVDIEPNNNTVVNEYIQFIGCEFSGNVAAGLQFNLQAPGGVHQGAVEVIGCHFHHNAYGVVLVGGDDFKVIGGSIYANTNNGVWMHGPGYTPINSNIQFLGVNIYLNGREGFVCDSTAQMINLTVSGGSIRNNSNSSSGNYHGMWINPAAGSRQLQVTNVIFDGATQRYPLRTEANLSHVTLIGNKYLAGSISSLPLLNDSITTRFRAEFASLMPAQNVTASRPSASLAGSGAQFYDTTLHKPIISDGTNWRDAMANIV